MNGLRATDLFQNMDRSSTRDGPVISAKELERGLKRFAAGRLQPKRSPEYWVGG